MAALVAMSVADRFKPIGSESGSTLPPPRLPSCAALTPESSTWRAVWITILTPGGMAARNSAAACGSTVTSPSSVGMPPLWSVAGDARTALNCVDVSGASGGAAAGAGTLPDADPVGGDAIAAGADVAGAGAAATGAPPLLPPPPPPPSPVAAGAAAGLELDLELLWLELPPLEPEL